MSSQQKVKPSQVKPGKIFGNVKPSQVKPEKFAGLPRPDSSVDYSLLVLFQIGESRHLIKQEVPEKTLSNFEKLIICLQK